jgi:integrase
MPTIKIAKPYPYLYRDIDRQGEVRWRLRAPGRKTVTIKGAFGSPEFAANYRAGMGGIPAEKVGVPTKHGTMAALARRYLHSADFAALAPTTQRVRRQLVEKFVEQYGNQAVAGLERRHVRAIMDSNAGKPGKARNVLTMLRLLIAIAMDEGTIAANPTTGIKQPKLSKDGWHAWTEEEVAQYEATYPIGSQARLALALALYTGQRSADLIKMGRQHVKDGRINVVQQKTGARLWIPIHVDLKAIMDATPTDNLTFLVSELGKPYASANSFGIRMKRWACEAGLNGCSIHGLRKACCRRSRGRVHGT